MYINYHFINSQHSMVNFIHGTTHLRFHGWENCTCIQKLLLNLILTNEKTNDISYKTPKKANQTGENSLFIFSLSDQFHIIILSSPM